MRLTGPFTGPQHYQPRRLYARQTIEIKPDVPGIGFVPRNRLFQKLSQMAVIKRIAGI
jgi:hypothetical protein